MLAAASAVAAAGCAAGTTRNDGGAATIPAVVAATSPGGPSVGLGGEAAATWVDVLAAQCPVPAGWRADPLDASRSGTASQVWRGPSGSTAYGVIAVRSLLLPLASDHQVLGEFLRQMRAAEGTAALSDERPDPTLAGGLGGLRFVARGGRYLMRGNLFSRGTRAWVVYAGTLVADPVHDDELRSAERARDGTTIDPPTKH